MSHGVEEAVDATVLHHAGGVGGLDAFSLEILFDVQAGGFEHVDGVLAVAGAGVADVDDLALDVLQSLDAGILGGHEGDGFGSECENGAQILLRLAFPFGEAVVGLILTVSLRDAEFKIAGHDGVDVEHGSARGFHGGADAVLVLLGVDDLGDGAAGGVIDARDAARADGHEGGFGMGFKDRSAGEGHSQAEDSRNQVFVHVVSPFMSTFFSKLYEEAPQRKGSR